MKITQLRNATIIVEIGKTVLLVDPMLAPKGAIPALKYATRQRRRNPLVELPPITQEALDRVTHCLITHCQKGHFDHLDRAAMKWLRQRQMPVFCMAEDAQYLTAKGLTVHPLQPARMQPFLHGQVRPIPCVHGRGLVGKFMAHGHGYLLEFPSEPSLYLLGDTILTDTVKSCLRDNQPEIVVAPAGGAQFDIGGEIIMGAEDILEICALSEGVVIANHLEALDHCPVTRQQLQNLGEEHQLGEKLLIPEDGEAYTHSIARSFSVPQTY